jgi:hypothetical protein
VYELLVNFDDCTVWQAHEMIQREMMRLFVSQQLRQICNTRSAAAKVHTVLALNGQGASMEVTPQPTANSQDRTITDQYYQVSAHLQPTCTPDQRTLTSSLNNILGLYQSLRQLNLWHCTSTQHNSIRLLYSASSIQTPSSNISNTLVSSSYSSLQPQGTGTAELWKDILPRMVNPVQSFKKPEDIVGRNSKLLLAYKKSVTPRQLVHKIMVRPGVDNLLVSNTTDRMHVVHGHGNEQQ